MNRALFLHTWRSQRLKILIVFVALTVWGALLPIVYGTFGETFKDIISSGLIPEELTQFGGGDIFTLSGSIALGAIHPISLILNSIFAVGFATAAVAGERQRGTLEVLLARPISRRTAYVTLLAATLTFVGAAVLATIVGALVGSAIGGVLDQLALERLPLVWLNGFLLFGAIATIGLAASVSFDRLSPALGITVGIVVVRKPPAAAGVRLEMRPCGEGHLGGLDRHAQTPASLATGCSDRNCSRYSRAYRPPRARSSECVPCSTIRPRS